MVAIHYTNRYLLHGEDKNVMVNENKGIYRGSVTVIFAVWFFRGLDRERSLRRTTRYILCESVCVFGDYRKPSQL